MTTIDLSMEELAAIRSALNEVLELIDDWEFATRMGRSKDEIETLLRRLKQIEKGPD